MSTGLFQWKNITWSDESRFFLNKLNYSIRALTYSAEADTGCHVCKQRASESCLIPYAMISFEKMGHLVNIFMLRRVMSSPIPWMTRQTISRPQSFTKPVASIRKTTHYATLHEAYTTDFRNKSKN